MGRYPGEMDTSRNNRPFDVTGRFHVTFLLAGLWMISLRSPAYFALAFEIRLLLKVLVATLFFNVKLNKYVSDFRTLYGGQDFFSGTQKCILQRVLRQIHVVA